jgi:hypothetical protein
MLSTSKMKNLAIMHSILSISFDSCHHSLAALKQNLECHQATLQDKLQTLHTNSSKSAHQQLPLSNTQIHKINQLITD